MKKIHESGTGEVRARFKRGAVTQACAAAIALAGAGHTVSGSAGEFSLSNMLALPPSIFRDDGTSFVGE